MRNLSAFMLLLGAVLAFGWSVAPSADGAQEPPATGDVDVSFDIEGEDFDVEAQRAAYEEEGPPRWVVITVLLTGLAIGLALIAVLWKAVSKRRGTGVPQNSSQPPSDQQP